MSRYEEQPPDVRAWLLRIAESSSIAPSWHEALTRLSEESPAQERLAVYQAVRDSGWLPEDANLYLIAAHVEEMADAETARQLPDLDQRIEALEREYGDVEAGPWSNERAVEEYDELSDQYQEAWDAIFIGLLKKSGEHDIADLYSADPDEFARRYAAGERLLQTRVETGNAGSPDDLVQVASYTNVPQAELARNVLESEGIRAAVANLNLVLWQWEYSNATGGVSVHVLRADAPAAYALLTQARRWPPGNLPRWICPSCGQRISGEWDVCWHCGCSVDGVPGEVPVLQFAGPTPDGGFSKAAQQILRVLVAAMLIQFVLLPLAAGLVANAVVNAVFAGLMIWLMVGFAAAVDRLAEVPVTSDLDIPSRPMCPQTRSSVSKAIVRRAWQAAMFGCCGFSPLGIYSLRLLWKLASRNTPLGTADRWRVGFSFVFSIIAVLWCVMFVVMIGGSLLIALGSMVGRPS